MTERVLLEMGLLKTTFPLATLHESGNWVLIPQWTVPLGIWSDPIVTVCFQIPRSYPGENPYGFYVSPNSFRLKGGAMPSNASEASDTPYSGHWLKFSWQANAWFPTADITAGSNLLNFVNGFRTRLMEAN